MKNRPTVLLLLLAAALTAGAGAAEERAPLYHEALRPQFHFTARYWEEYQLHPPNHHEGWMNDINGLVQFDGEYHFFAQRWWSAWLHAVSTDLIHWEELPPAFGKGGRFGGTQSGGGVIDLHNRSGLGDGKTPPMVAFWSSTDNLNQCISYSRDHGRTWTKYEKNPVLTHPFRDPRVFWYEPDQRWILILYGPADGEPTRTLNYGFNGEQNDAHELRGATTGAWTHSILRVFPDGRVVVNDPAGHSEATIDAARQKVGADTFQIGAKANGSEFLDGDIAEILVYDRPLSEEESAQTLRHLETGAAAPAEGLALHLDAARAEAGEEGRVAQWRDLSGKGHDMSQPEAGRMPQRSAEGPAGRAALHFSGGQSLHGAAVLAEGDDSFTIAALWRRRQTAGSEVICEQNAAQTAAGRRAALLTVGREEQENHYLLFASTNLLEWTRLPGSIPDSFECPDMFELPVEGAPADRRWVVIDGNGDYLIGAFDGQRFTAEAGKRKGDHGRNFYATMTFENMPKEDPRRIQLAWMRGWDDYPKDMPFNQQASFPCELTLRPVAGKLTLCRNPIREISKLYRTDFSLPTRVLKPGENPLATVEGELLDIRLRLDVANSHCDRLVLDLRGNTVIYDLKKRTLESLGSVAPLEPDSSGIVEIRTLLDRLSLETFGNRGQVSITNIARQQKAPLELRAEGGEATIPSLELHELKSIWK